MLKIISWNVNGLKSIINKGLINFIKKENPDFLLLQEIKTNIIPLEFFSLNYKIYINSSKIKKGYSGVLTLSKYNPLNVKYGLGIEKFDLEGRIITLEFEKFYLINVYFPNAGVDNLKRLDFKIEFDKEFEKFVLSLNKPVIIGGDFNVAHTEDDIYDPEHNTNHAGFTLQEREWFDHFLKLGFVDTFRIFYKGKGYYTWWSYKFNAREKNLGWRIDYFIVSESIKNNVKRSYILKDVLGSDHAPIVLEIDI